MEELTNLKRCCMIMIVRTDIMEEKVKMLKEQIYARLRGETPRVQVQLSGITDVEDVVNGKSNS